jgi:spoIIIJ-associated protein
VKTIESAGRTIEEALEAGLRELHCTISDVTWTPLQEGAKGLFGLFGSRPAKVRITLNDDSDDDDALTGDILSSLLENESAETVSPKKPTLPASATATVPARVSTSTAATPPTPPPAAVSVQAAETDLKLVPAPAAQNIQPTNRPPEKQQAHSLERRPLPQRSHVGSAQQNRQPPGGGIHTYSKPYAPQERKAQRPVTPHTEFVREPFAQIEPVPAPSEPPIIYPADTPLGRAQKYITELTRLMGVNSSVYVTCDDDGHVHANVYGDTAGVLIGRRGETLDALQYLTGLYVNRAPSSAPGEVAQTHGAYTRVTVDTENYRSKREEALRRLAQRLATRAIRFGRRVALEPMNPYERRIIHASLQEFVGVTTYSEGEEPNRYVVIAPKRAEHGAAPRYSPKAEE